MISNLSIKENSGKSRTPISYVLSTTKSNSIQMAAEGAICSFGAEGLETYSLMALGALAIGMFSVFGGKFFKKSESDEEIEVAPQEKLKKID